MVITGLERLLREPDLLSRSGSLGLLYNQASIDSNFRSAADLIASKFADRLVALFGPQHGVFCTEQDNMIETAHAVHRRLGLPIYSLYSETRRPFPEMLKGIDTILVDIQDVGTRVYTFATTVLYLMQACAQTGKRLVILDRPNPINGFDIEGNVLEPDFSSFVGPFPLPMRHGLTLGELMFLYNENYEIHCELEIIKIEGWNRTDYFEQLGIPWVLPSPNIPLVETAVVYPGQVILEGTNVSEGRGTTRPFEIFGAPYIEPEIFLDSIEPQCLDGVTLREIEFKPTFNKWAGEACHGFQIHVTDRKSFRPYRFTLAVLATLLKLYPIDFRWSEPPYEYVADKLPIDIILGDSRIRESLEKGESIPQLEEKWEPHLSEFMKIRAQHLLY